MLRGRTPIEISMDPPYRLGISLVDESHHPRWHHGCMKLLKQLRASTRPASQTPRMSRQPPEITSKLEGDEPCSMSRGINEIFPRSSLLLYWIFSVHLTDAFTQFRVVVISIPSKFLLPVPTFIAYLFFSTTKGTSPFGLPLYSLYTINLFTVPLMKFLMLIPAFNDNPQQR